jgi:[acyl-carrier-protein] S-malonyltransferase
MKSMIAVVFPGQGSQKPGMGKALFDLKPEAREVFERVSAATGDDVAKLCFESDEETLRQTQNAQIALYTTGVAAWSCLHSHLQGVTEIAAFAGHSVGEFAALCAAQILSVEDGAELVRRRGEIMAEAGAQQPGTMAAVLGLEREQIEVVLKTVGGVVVVANDNCPGQLVISGEVEAVGKAGEALVAAGAKRVLPLNVSGAFHSPLMESSAAEMRKALDSAHFATGAGRVFSNVTAQPVVQLGVWPDLLERQLKSPVRWTETIQNALNEGIGTFIECGSGDVLTGLLKRIDRDSKGLKVNDLESLEAAVAAVRA